MQSINDQTENKKSTDVFYQDNNGSRAPCKKSKIEKTKPFLFQLFSARIFFISKKTRFKLKNTGTLSKELEIRLS